MNKNTMKKYAPVMAVIGAILLLAGGGMIYNPVMAVSAHDDQAEVKRMLAITTFEVEPTYTSCSQLSMTLLMSYDNNPQNGIIGLSEFGKAAADHGDGFITSDTLDQISYAWTSACPVDLPSDPARINDDTDTLNCDPKLVKPGDTVWMTAGGYNEGGEEWHGSVKFTVTNPDGNVFLIHEAPYIVVQEDDWRNVNFNFDLPSDAASGTWTLQSKWIDDDGNVHAMTTIDLGAEEILGINRLGGILALLGILLLIGGFTARRR